nr:MAG TPA: hypothetical protein [Caudoviricetes sp.]
MTSCLFHRIFINFNFPCSIIRICYCNSHYKINKFSYLINFHVKPIIL